MMIVFDSSESILWFSLESSYDDYNFSGHATHQSELERGTLIRAQCREGYS
jgi:hypothetical protein